MPKYGDIGRMTDVMREVWTFMVLRPASVYDFEGMLLDTDVSDRFVGVILDGETVYKSGHVGPGDIGPIRESEDIEWLE